MTWPFFTILAAVTWAFVNVADKIIISKLTREPAVPVIVMNGIGLLVGVGIFFVQGVPLVTGRLINNSIILGLFAMLPSYFYFAAAKDEEISRVVPLFQLANLITPFIAFFTIGEVFHLRTYASIGLMVIGAILISSKQFFPIRPTRAFWLMIAAAVTYAIYGVILKHLLQFWDFWTLFGAMRFATFVLAIPLAVTYKESLSLLWRTQKLKGVLMISGNEFLSMLGVFFHAIATSLGPITLVNALTSVQPFLVLGFSAFVTMMAPQLLSEIIDRQTMTRKMIATACIIIGALGIQY